jgi:hypothetical protein
MKRQSLLASLLLLNCSCSGAKFSVNLFPPQINLKPQYAGSNIYLVRDPNFSVLAGIQDITSKQYSYILNEAKKASYPDNLLIINKAIYIEPQNPEAYFVKAIFLEQNNRLSEAVQQKNYGNLLKEKQLKLQTIYQVKAPEETNDFFTWYTKMVEELIMKDDKHN